MLQSEYRTAATEELIQWNTERPIKSFVPLEISSQVQAFMSYYWTACKVYNMPRFDGIFDGPTRHNKVIRWILENQKLFLRYHQMVEASAQIAADYRQAIAQRADADDTIKFLVDEYGEALSHILYTH